MSSTRPFLPQIDAIDLMDIFVMRSYAEYSTSGRYWRLTKEGIKEANRLIKAKHDDWFHLTVFKYGITTEFHKNLGVILGRLKPRTLRYELPVRVVNMLEGLGVHTAEDLFKVDLHSLTAIKGFGAGALCDVKWALKKLGYRPRFPGYDAIADVGGKVADWVS